MSDRRVLIADDTEDMRALVSIVLLGAGVTIVGQGKDGNEALELWRTSRPPRLHAVILDQRMPGRTGLEVAEEILAEDPEQRIILLSAHVDPEMTAAAEALGITAVVPKEDILGLPEHLAFPG
ncbi:response regulator transcription factor [Euzebya tangerina]|uniref:response regulator transcription factor n=1 Tax=Euzebya tangerina TaxID=591198 RepID=UPI000E311E79|nr:response regulator transcription factor [Euzebya tangerina]